MTRKTTPKSSATASEATVAPETRETRLKSRFYVIRKDDNGWTPIVAVIAGPKSPALSTMRKRFDEAFLVPAWNFDGKTAAALGYFNLHGAAMERIRAQGYMGMCEAELFVDWLLKTDSRFERIDFQEISL